MKSWRARTLGILLVCVQFATQSLWAYASESNFWFQRHRRASAPSAGADELLQRLPDLSPHALSSSLSSDVLRTLPPGFVDRNAALLSALAAEGTVRGVSFPKGASSRLVVHIQDVHMNPDAQAHIGRAVRALVEAKAAGLVALEGAFGAVDLSRFRAFPDRAAVEKAADHLFRGQEISGALHAALTSRGEIPPVVGVDDLSHYRANVAAYAASAPLMPGIRAAVSDEKRRLAARKAAVFNSVLKALDDRVEGYRRGDVSLGDYAEALAAQAESPAAVRTFLAALRMERSLDFKKVESERAELLRGLAASLPPERLQDLARRAASFRAGGVRYAEFYRFLEDLCRQAGAPMSRFPSMEAYVRYVSLADGISPEKLFGGLQSLERDAYARLAKTAEERGLLDESRRLHLAGKLADFALSPEEWAEYRKGEAPAEKELPALSSFKSFYEEAQARDERMSENLLRALEARGASVAVLVAGGYHAPGLARRLTEAGAAVVSFVPRIDKVDTAQGSAYLSVFTREKTPLENLFQGRTLFLAPEQFPESTEVGAAARAAVVAGQKEEAEKIRALSAEAGAAAVTGEKERAEKTRALFESLVPRLAGRFRESVVAVKGGMEFRFQNLLSRGGARFSVFLTPDGEISSVAYAAAGTGLSMGLLLGGWAARAGQPLWAVLFWTLAACLVPFLAALVRGDGRGGGMSFSLALPQGFVAALKEGRDPLIAVLSEGGDGSSSALPPVEESAWIELRESMDALDRGAGLLSLPAGGSLSENMGRRLLRLLPLTPAGRARLLKGYAGILQARLSSATDEEKKPLETTLALVTSVGERALTSFPVEEVFAARLAELLEPEKFKKALAEAEKKIGGLSAATPSEDLFDPGFAASGKVAADKPAAVDRAVETLLAGLGAPVPPEEFDQAVNELRLRIYRALLARPGGEPRRVQLANTTSRDGQQSNAATAFSGEDQRRLIGIEAELGNFHDLETWGGAVIQAALLKELRGDKPEDPFHNLAEQTALLEEKLKDVLEPYRSAISAEDWSAIFDRYRRSADRKLLSDREMDGILSKSPGLPEAAKAAARARYGLRQEMLLRGQFIVGLTPYPENVLNLFVDAAYKNGMDVFRIFNAFNDPRDIVKTIASVRRYEALGARVQPCIHYTTDFPLGIDGYVEIARELVKASGDALDALVIKDAGGLLEPDQAYKLVKALREGGITQPLHIHTHDVRGNRQLALLEAIRANGPDGVIRVDLAAGKDQLSAPFAQPDLRDFLRLTRGTAWAGDTRVDDAALDRLEKEVSEIIVRYPRLPVTSAERRDVVAARLPGGMKTNFIDRQVVQFFRKEGAKIPPKFGVALLDGAGELTPEGKRFIDALLPHIYDEMRQVTRDMGGISLVTPSSQWIGTQSFMNVVMAGLNKGWYAWSANGESLVPTDARPAQRAGRYALIITPTLQNYLIQWAQDPLLQRFYPGVDRGLVLRSFRDLKNPEVDLEVMKAALEKESVDLEAVSRALAPFREVQGALGQGVTDMVVMRLAKALAATPLDKPLRERILALKDKDVPLTVEEMRARVAVDRKEGMTGTDEDLLLLSLFPAQAPHLFQQRVEWGKKEPTAETEKVLRAMGFPSPTEEEPAPASARPLIDYASFEEMPAFLPGTALDPSDPPLRVADFNDDGSWLKRGEAEELLPRVIGGGRATVEEGVAGGVHLSVTDEAKEGLFYLSFQVEERGGVKTAVLDAGGYQSFLFYRAAAAARPAVDDEYLIQAQRFKWNSEWIRGRLFPFLVKKGFLQAAVRQENIRGAIGAHFFRLLGFRPGTGAWASHLVLPLSPSPTGGPVSGGTPGPAAASVPAREAPRTNGSSAAPLRRLVELPGVLGKIKVGLRIIPGNPLVTVSLHGLGSVGENEVKRRVLEKRTQGLTSLVFPTSSRNETGRRGPLLPGKGLEDGFRGKSFWDEREDGLRVLRHLIRHSWALFGVRPSKIRLILVPQSYGGLTTMLSAPSISHVKALMLLATADQIHEKFSFYKLDLLTTVPRPKIFHMALGNFPGPLKFLIGELDEFFNILHARRLAEASGRGDSFELIPGMRHFIHGDPASQEEVGKRFSQLLDQVIAAGNASSGETSLFDAVTDRLLPLVPVEVPLELTLTEGLLLLERLGVAPAAVSIQERMRAAAVMETLSALKDRFAQGLRALLADSPGASNVSKRRQATSGLGLWIADKIDPRLGAFYARNPFAPESGLAAAAALSTGVWSVLSGSHAALAAAPVIGTLFVLGFVLSHLLKPEALEKHGLAVDWFKVGLTSSLYLAGFWITPLLFGFAPDSSLRHAVLLAAAFSSLWAAVMTGQALVEGMELSPMRAWSDAATGIWYMAPDGNASSGGGGTSIRLRVRELVRLKKGSALLKFLREKAGLNKEALGNYQTLYRLEAEPERSPSPEILGGIIQALTAAYEENGFFPADEVGPALEEAYGVKAVAAVLPGALRPLPSGMEAVVASRRADALFKLLRTDAGLAQKQMGVSEATAYAIEKGQHRDISSQKLGEVYARLKAVYQEPEKIKAALEKVFDVPVFETLSRKDLLAEVRKKVESRDGGGLLNLLREQAGLFQRDFGPQAQLTRFEKHGSTPTPPILASLIGPLQKKYLEDGRLSADEVREALEEAYGVTAFHRLEADELRVEVGRLANAKDFGALLLLLRLQVGLSQGSLGDDSSVSDLESGERDAPQATADFFQSILTSLKKAYKKDGRLKEEEVEAALKSAAAHLSVEEIRSRVFSLSEEGKGGELVVFLRSQTGLRQEDIGHVRTIVALEKAKRSMPTKGAMAKLISTLGPACAKAGLLTGEEVRQVLERAFRWRLGRDELLVEAERLIAAGERGKLLRLLRTEKRLKVEAVGPSTTITELESLVPSSKRETQRQVLDAVVTRFQKAYEGDELLTPAEAKDLIDRAFWKLPEAVLRAELKEHITLRNKGAAVRLLREQGRLVQEDFSTYATFLHNLESEKWPGFTAKGAEPVALILQKIPEAYAGDDRMKPSEVRATLQDLVMLRPLGSFVSSMKSLSESEARGGLLNLIRNQLGVSKLALGKRSLVLDILSGEDVPTEKELNEAIIPPLRKAHEALLLEARLPFKEIEAALFAAFGIQPAARRMVPVQILQTSTPELSDVEFQGMVASSRGALAFYGRDLDRIRRLSGEERDALAGNYQMALESGDQGLIKKTSNDLVLSSLPLVLFALKQYWSRMPRRVKEDAVGEGNLGLMHAAKKFDPARGVKFSGYAMWWINAYVGEFLKKNRFIVTLKSVNNPKYVAKQLAERGGELSLDMSYDNEGGAGSTLLGRLADDSAASPEHGGEMVFIERLLGAFLPTLPLRERAVFERAFLKEESYKAIGDDMELSRERIRQIAEKAKQKFVAFAGQRRDESFTDVSTARVPPDHESVTLPKRFKPSTDAPQKVLEAVSDKIYSVSGLFLFFGLAGSGTQKLVIALSPLTLLIAGIIAWSAAAIVVLSGVFEKRAAPEAENIPPSEPPLNLGLEGISIRSEMEGRSLIARLHAAKDDPGAVDALKRALTEAGIPLDPDGAAVGRFLSSLAVSPDGGHVYFIPSLASVGGRAYADALAALMPTNKYRVVTPDAEVRAAFPKEVVLEADQSNWRSLRRLQERAGEFLKSHPAVTLFRAEGVELDRDGVTLDVLRQAAVETITRALAGTAAAFRWDMIPDLVRAVLSAA